MTTQIADGVAYQGNKYILCGCNGTDLFEPRSYGLNPAAPSTACYRGWMAEYAVSGNLVLQDLFVFHDAGLPVKNKKPNGPPINAIKPTDPDSWCGFNCIYKELNIPLPFTGGLLIAEGFIRELRVNMGYHPFWKFQSVLELVFKNGELQSSQDQSSVAKAIREKHLVPGILGGNQLSDDSAVKAWIEESFSLNYNLVPKVS